MWTLDAKSSGEDITLTWDAGGVPANVSLRLTDTGPDIDMKTQTGSVLGPGTYSLTITATTASLTTVGMPAAFTVSALSIPPAEVEIGESITISVLVTNIGDGTGIYKAILTLDNVEKATKEVTLAGGASEKVTFTIAKDKAGTYAVDIERLSGLFVVKEKVTLPTPPSTLEQPPAPSPAPAKLTSWPILSGIIVGVIVVGFLIFRIARRTGY